MNELRPDEIMELVSCALNTTGTMRPWSRLRLRVCEHLIGRGLLEAVKPETCCNTGGYPAIIPTLKKGATVRLTAAGKLAVRKLAVRDYGEFFPVAADIRQAQQRVDSTQREGQKHG